MSKFKVILIVALERFSFFIPQALYLKLQFLLRMGYKLNLQNPKTFSEKLQWLKLYYRDPSYYSLVDKYEVKKHVSNAVGQKYVIPTIGVWDKAEDINWASLPERFVLKTTHGGGRRGVVICKDKSNLDRNKAISDLNDSMKQDISKSFLEWPYSGVAKKIIAEEYMEQEDGGELKEYKFFCFDGVPLFLYVRHKDNKTGEIFVNFINPDWSPSYIKRSDIRSSEILPPKPQVLEKMLNLAKILSCGICFARIDLYEINGNIYFSEITFFPGSGLLPFDSKKTDLKIGELLKLPKRNN